MSDPIEARNDPGSPPCRPAVTSALSTAGWGGLFPAAMAAEATEGEILRAIALTAVGCILGMTGPGPEHDTARNALSVRFAATVMTMCCDREALARLSVRAVTVPQGPEGEGG